MVASKGDETDGGISTLESRIEECAECKVVEEEKLDMIVEETGGVTKKLRLELEEKTQELAPPQQERTVFQNSLDTTAQMEVNLLEDAVARALEELPRAEGELKSIESMQGATRTELVECELELTSNKLHVEWGEGELGELRRRKSMLAKKSAMVLVSPSE